jgi:MoaA/NifB/PqqE/SkfB family radical SAM enzyme
MKIFKDKENQKSKDIPIKLYEVLWEITRKCNMNCKYCGSSKVKTTENPTDSQIITILSELTKYPPDIVTITGGEPGCLGTEELDKVIGILSDAGIKVRIVTNGTFLSYKDWYKNFNKVEIIGLSVNEPWPYWFDYVDGLEKDLTIITNFGTHNIFYFDELAKFVKDNHFNTWQIQLTMGEFLLQPEGIEYLRNKIRKLDGVNYILSDNLQDEHICSAGINSCSITAEGFICHCLSERSRNKDCLVGIVGDLNKDSLQNIWETGFKEARFGSGWTNTCRNCIKYPEVKKLTSTITIPKRIDIVYPDNPGWTPEEKPWCQPRVTMYGVGRGNVFSYGVTNWKIVSVSRYGDLVNK